MMRGAVYNLCTVIFLLVSSLAYAGDSAVFSEIARKCLSDALYLAEAETPTSTAMLSDRQKREVELRKSKNGLLVYLETHSDFAPALVRYITDCKEVEKIGEGGMGFVYRVIDTEGKEWVIKIAKPSRAPEHHDRILNEAATAALAHRANPHFFPKTEYVEELGIIKMDFVKGDNFRNVMNSLEYLGLPPEKKQELQTVILTQATRALSEMHKAGVIHRDIKPDNIMITGDIRDPRTVQVKIIDFGLGKNLNQEFDPFPKDRALGTLDYLSVSGLRGEGTASQDYYALYVSLQQMFSPEKMKEPYTYLANYMKERKIPTPWGTWPAEDRPDIAKDNEKLRAMMLLFRYPPAKGTDINGLPNLGDMMAVAMKPSVAPGSPAEEKFWGDLNLHIKARDSKEQALIYLGDDALIRRGKEKDSDFIARLGERLPELAKDLKWEAPTGSKSFAPTDLVIHDLTAQGKDIVAPFKVAAAPIKIKVPALPKAEVAAPSPATVEPRGEKPERRLYYAVAASIAATFALASGVTWDFMSRPAESPSIMVGPSTPPKLVPVDEKAEKKPKPAESPK